ncbi:MAG: tyrosine-type recombinase/integrase [Candidatus Pacearchaeota archaeon]|nr:tyrosine-type recombinase/integrase [Candidatus Pacearchaeota archaeon]
MKHHYKLIKKFKQEHQLRGSSERTIAAYTDNCIKAFEHIRKAPFEITKKDLIQYIHYLIGKGYTAKTCNQKIYSIKSFYKLLGKGGKENPTSELPRQKEPVKIPEILGKKEVTAVLCSLKNLKLKALLATAYFGGLRLEEVRLLKITDINSDRMVIHISGKGDKQRLVPLHQEPLGLLREYYKRYRPKEWLFEGRGINKPLCRRSLHAMVKRAVRLAGIKTKVSMHTLRHCFATHLLENGVALQVIQQVLGHKSIRTTEYYTHVTTEMLRKVKSPLEALRLDSPSQKKGGRNA